MTQIANPISSNRPRLARRLLRSLLPVLVIGTAVGVWQRERLWIWYCAERLERASDENRSLWAEKLVAAGEPAVPSLLDLLRNDDAGVCAAAKGALLTMVESWPQDDPRRLEFNNRFVDAEPRFSTPGRAAALDLLPAVRAACDARVAERVTEIVATTAKSESIDVRLRAVAAAMDPRIDCLTAIIPLTRDPAPEVRRAAVLALGPIRDGGRAVLEDDGLLRCLHDEDAEVRQLAEMGLRSRGRSPRDIRLGRRYTAPDARERQKLLIDLAFEEELDVTVWLERLTMDADPAVRAGAARLAAERRSDLADRLGQMSQSDPDVTVRRIAEYYRQRLLASR